jgi:uncharacterized membrane protein YqjE
MRFIAEFILSVVELLESEARAFKLNILALVSYLVFLAAGMLVLLAGAAILLWAFYELLVTVINPIAAAFIIGGVTLVAGFLMVFGIRGAASRRR